MSDDCANTVNRNGNDNEVHVGTVKELLGQHIKSCVVHDIREGKDDVVDELVCTLQKLMK